MKPLEAMARAIFEHWEFQPVKSLPVPWVPGGNSMKQDTARAYARAALVALRDCGVTEGMKVAHSRRAEHGIIDIEPQFRAMLDAALQEDSGSNGRPG